MPYLLPRNLTNSRVLILILAFGDLSHLEACTVLSDEILEARMICDRVSTLSLSEQSPAKKIQRLAGIHKLVVPHSASFSENIERFGDEITKVFGTSEKKLNFSVSLYCSSHRDSEDDEYEEVVSTVLQVVREAGFRKANLLRPHNGMEMLANDVLARNALDIVVYPAKQGYYATGTTAFIPDFERMRSRGISRPIASPEISLSPRLAKLLINLGALSKGSLLLDPFCGAGTILIEAVLQGINCIGVDKNPSRIGSTKRNLAWISSTYSHESSQPSPTTSLGSWSLEVGDAEKLGAIMKGKGKVDAVVTEPILLPRFTSMPSISRARKAIKRASLIYSTSLYSISEAVKKGGRIIMVVPSIKTYEGKEVSITLEGFEEIGLREFQPRGRGHTTAFAYPVRLAFESTRWIRRLVYVFERT